MLKMLVGLFILILTSCGSNDAQNSNAVTNVTVLMGNGIAAGALAPAGTIPDNIQSITLDAIDANGTALITPPINAKGPQFSTTLTIDNGVGIQIRAKAFDAQGTLIYSGSSLPQDLTGASITVSVILSMTIHLQAAATTVLRNANLSLTGKIAGVSPTATSPLLWQANDGSLSVAAGSFGAQADWTAPNKLGQVTITAKIDPQLNPDQDINVVGQTTVDVINGLPTLTLSANTISINEGTTDNSITASASDIDGDALTFSLGISAPSWASIDATTGILTLSPPPGSINTDIPLIVSDAIGDTATQQLAVTIIAVDALAPIITVPANITVAAINASGTPNTNTSISTFLNAASATDNLDGTITVSNNAPATFSLGINTITFTATDTAANTASATASVNITDQSAPVITLLGTDPFIVQQNTAFSDPGSNVKDNVDTGLSASISGTVNTAVSGSYTLTYSVSDAAGNTALLRTRTVIVNNAPIAGKGKVSLQQGLNRYKGTQDTELRMDTPDENYARNPTITIDGAVSPSAASQDTHMLLQFNQLFGALPNQIPVGAVIQTASLRLYMPSGGNNVEMKQMLTSWDQNTATWNSHNTAINNATLLRTLIGRPVVGSPLDVSFSSPSFDVAKEVQSWANGVSNFGWGFKPANSASLDGVDFATGEHATIARRPLLNVDYVASQLAIKTAINTNITLTLDGIDADNQTLSTKLTTLPSNGTLYQTTDGTTLGAAITTSPSIVTNANKQVIFVPTADFSGQTSFTFIVNDGIEDALNPATVILYVDTIAPVITLIGGATTVSLNSVYTDTGATALDNVDGNITGNIITNNPVDTAVAGTYTVRYDLLDAAGNAATQVTRSVKVDAPPVAGVTTQTFRQGVNGYIGGEDAELREATPTTVVPHNIITQSISIDGNAGGGFDSVGLIQFTNIFGAGTNQIPLSSNILNATLDLYLSSGGHHVDVKQMNAAWNQNTATWGNSYAATVVSPQLRRLVGRPISGSPLNISGTFHTFDVFPEMENWSNGTANNGWAFLPFNVKAYDGVDFGDSERTNIAKRPQLTVTYQNPALTIPSLIDVNVTIALNGYDANGDTLISTVATLPTNGKLYQTADGTTLGAAISLANTAVSSSNQVIFVPNNTYLGADTFTYTVNDGVSTSTAATINFAVNPPVGFDTIWTGAINTAWNNALNWSAGVPTNLLNAFIPASAANQPILTAAATVKNITVQTGATLDVANFTLTAVGNVDAGNTITGTTGVLIMSGANTTLQGTVPNLTINGSASVQLAGTTTVTTGPKAGTLTINNAGTLDIYSQSLDVYGSLTVSAKGTKGLLMQNPAGVMTVRGNAVFNAAGQVQNAANLTAGTLHLQGNLTATNNPSFASAGTHKVVLDGTAAQAITFSGGTSTASNRFNDLEVSNISGVNLGTSYVTGQLTMLGSAVATGANVYYTTKLPVTNASYGVTNNHIPNGGSIQLFQPIVIHDGGVAGAGNLIIDNAGTLDIYSQSLDVYGSLTVSANGTKGLLMQNPAGVMTVRGNAVFNAAGQAQNAANLTAGTLHLQGNLTATNTPSFASAGTHKVVLDGLAAQSITFPGGTSATSNRFNDLEVSNVAGVNLGTSYVTGQLTMLGSGVATGANVYYTTKLPVTNASYGVTNNHIPNVGSIQLFQPIVIHDGGIAGAGNLIIDNAGTLDIYSQSLDVYGNLTVVMNGTKGLLMQNPAGVMTVRGNAVFDAIGAVQSAANLTAGTLHLQGNLTATNTPSFASAGTHKVVLDGLAAQSITFSGGPTNRFNDLEVSNTTGVNFANNTTATGTLTITAANAVTLSSSGATRTLTVGSADVDGATFDNLLLAITGGIIKFDNITFVNYVSTATPLQLNFSGQTVTLNNLNFNSPLTTGFHIGGTGTGNTTTINGTNVLVGDERTAAGLVGQVTWVGQPTNSAPIASMPTSNALQFDGVNDYVSTAASVALTNIANTFTMEAWVNPTATHTVVTESTLGVGGTSNQRYAIFPTLNIDDTTAGAGISVGTNGVQVFEHANGYLPALLSWSGTINNWTHVAVVYNNKTPSLYIDGTLVRTGLPSPKANVYPGNSRLGGFDLYGAYAGQMDEVRIWNTARTQTQIQADMNATLAGSETGLVGYWNFDEGTGTAATDSTNNANNGTLGAGVVANQPLWVINPITVTIQQGENLTIPLGGSDIDGQPLTAKITTLPTLGTLYQTTDGITLGAAIGAVPTTVTHANKQVIFVPANGSGAPYTTFGYVVNDGLVDSAAATVTINVAPGTIISAANGNNIIAANTTWNISGSPYWVQDLVSVTTGTLQIDANVVVKFNGGIGLKVNNGGTLNMSGGVGSEVILTSANDNLNGATLAGSTGLPSAGDWKYVFYNSGSTGTILNAKVLYGGGTNGAVYISGSSPILTNIAIADSGAAGLYIDAWNGTTANSNITNVTITNPSTRGIFLSTVTTGIVTTTISGTTISGVPAGLEGIYLTSTGTGGTMNPTISGFTVTGGQYSLFVNPGLSGSFTNNTFSGATIAGIYLGAGATVTIDNTNSILNAAYPYHLVGTVLPVGVSAIASGSTDGKNLMISGTFDTGTYNLTANPLGIGSQWLQTGSIFLLSGVTMNIDPGVIFKRKSNVITVNAGATLNMNGTNVNPITFTSWNDDTIGSTVSGSSGSPARGEGITLTYQGGSFGTMVFVNNHYAGQVTLNAAIPISDYLLQDSNFGLSLSATATSAVTQTINNLTINHWGAGGGTALTINGANGTTTPVFTGKNVVNKNTATHPAVSVTGVNANPTFAEFTIDMKGFNQAALLVTSSATGTYSKNIFQNALECVYVQSNAAPTLSNNIMRNCTTGISLGKSNFAGWSPGAALISDNKVVNNTGNGIYVAGAATGLVLEHNLIRGNGTAGIFVDKLIPSNLSIRNNLIVENKTANTLSALYIKGDGLSAGPTVSILGNTIADNQSVSITTAGLVIEDYPIVTVHDNILSNNLRSNATAGDLSIGTLATITEDYNLTSSVGAPAGFNGASSLQGPAGLLLNWYLSNAATSINVDALKTVASVAYLGGHTFAQTTVPDTGNLDLGYHHAFAAPTVNAIVSSVVASTTAPAIGGTSAIKVTPKNSVGTLLGSGLKVTATITKLGNTTGTISSAKDLGNGTYEFTFTTTALGGGNDTINLSANGVVLATTVTITW